MKAAGVSDHCKRLNVVMNSHYVILFVANGSIGVVVVIVIHRPCFSMMVLFQPTMKESELRRRYQK